MDLSSLPGPASYAVAAAARSILACPATADLEVDRLPLAIDDALLGEAGGRPTLTCEVGSPLARAAAARSVARLRVGSAVRGGAGDALVLAGRLGPLETTTCASCADEHLVVTLDPAAALVTLADHRHQLPLGDYLSPAHQLNRGHLQRSLEHLEEHHHLDLRRRWPPPPAPRSTTWSRRGCATSTRAGSASSGSTPAGPTRCGCASPAARPAPPSWAGSCGRASPRP